MYGDDDGRDRELEDRFDFYHDEGLISGARILSWADRYPCYRCAHWEAGAGPSEPGRCTSNGEARDQEGDDTCSQWERRPKRG